MVHGSGFEMERWLALLESISWKATGARHLSFIF